MGGYLNVPVYLTTPPPPPSSPPPPLPHKPNLPMLYYGIVVVATATIVLAIYHLIIVRLCTIQYHRRWRNSATSNTIITPPSPSLSRGSSAAVYLISSFKYTKGSNNNNYDNHNECSVCLSVFEEGEDVKKLPMCNHCFHASCIDMWLNSHIHCPLCRAAVAVPPRQPPPPPGRSTV